MLIDASTRPEAGFVVLSKAVLTDPGLSLRARGLYACLMARGGGRAEDFLIACDPSEDIQAAAKELMEHIGEAAATVAPPKAPASKSMRPDDVSEQTWADFSDLRKRKKAPVTPTALAGIRREADRAGWSMDDALKECCLRGWQGFKADWVQQRSAEPAYQRSMREKYERAAPAIAVRMPTARVSPNTFFDQLEASNAAAQ